MTPIYLDHNATTPVAPEVLDAMLPYFRERFGNPSSNHRFGAEAKEGLEKAREEVAGLIAAEPEQILFTSGGTEASQVALLGAAAALRDRRPDGGLLRIVSFLLEHPATLEPLALLERGGDRVVLVPADPNGVVRIDRFLAEWTAEPAPDLASLMHAHNETGAIQPVERVGEASRRAGGLFHVDAAQSIGKIPVDVGRIGCDLLSIAGHKLYAPKGVGALFVRDRRAIRPLQPGGGQEGGLRGGTPNVAGAVGLGAACRLAARRLAEGATQRLAGLRDSLWQRLDAAIPGLVRTTGPAPTLPNTLHLRFPRVTGNALLAATPEIAASTGSACHAGSDRPPAGIVALGVPEEEALGSVRLSLGHGSTEEDLAAAAAALIRSWNSLAGGKPGADLR